MAQKGSHVQFKHKTKRGRVTVPHPKRDIAIGTLRSIEKQAQSIAIDATDLLRLATGRLARPLLHLLERLSLSAVLDSASGRSRPSDEATVRAARVSSCARRASSSDSTMPWQVSPAMKQG